MSNIDIVTHELWHMYMFLQGIGVGYEESANDAHHRIMTEPDSQYSDWLREMFLDREEKFYEYVPYSGTYDSPTFKDLPKDEQEEIYKYLKKEDLK